MNKKLVKALRGAVCTANDKAEIAKRTAELYDTLLESNNLAEADIISLVFSVTPDLDAVNPAAALRETGRAGELALMVFGEAPIQKTLPGVIRVLAHCYIDSEKPVKHQYIRGAEKLRPDRSAMQPAAIP